MTVRETETPLTPLTPTYPHTPIDDILKEIAKADHGPLV